MNDSTRAEIEGLLARARGLVPEDLLPVLPPQPELLGAPAWYPFEHELWKVGEDIRQALVRKPRLRSDQGLQRSILELATDRRAHRGRQSFIMLLGHRAASAHGAAVANHLDDPGVAGQVIWALYRMRAHGFNGAVSPFLEDDKAWIRREARRYLAWEAGG